ncbi:unnamed protein product [Ectocarpus sp. CCAP 1310/34]|nr:unnamed protein product [Ectocarpus sp. CCAP 1310/34]
MARRTLSAVGVAAVAMMQSPADSLLGSASIRQQRTNVYAPPAATCSGRDVNKAGSSGVSPRILGGGRAPPSSRGGLRRPAPWRLPSVRGGGGGAEEPPAARRGDATAAAGVDRTDTSPVGSSRSPVTTASATTTNGSGSSNAALGGGEKEATISATAPVPPFSMPPRGSPGKASDFGSSSDDSTLDIRERAGFSLFRCDAYHCEREMVESGEISASAPATTQVMMRWNERPRRALVLLKPDRDLLPLAAQTIDYLQRDMRLKVMVETAAVEAVGQALDEFTEGDGGKLEVFTPPERSVVAEMGPRGGAGPAPPLDGDSVDFVLTLGGDGLLMYSNTLFRRSVPPHLCFNLGSMGFLSPFEYESMKEEVRRIMSGGMKVSLRMRLSARIIRDDQTSEAFHALNEIVIDRGSSPYLTNLECYCDEEHLTTVQADGLIIATPTGSTAYSMSAGGSMVHPCVPAILFTPICPHSLSFRPIVFPDTVVLRLCMPQEARAEARVSFDGKLSQDLCRGDTLVIKTSNFPVPTICKDDSTADWFASLDQALGFNTRMKQREFKPVPTMTDVSRQRNDDRIND